MAIFDFDNPEGTITIGGLLLNDVWITVVNLLDFLPQPDERGDNTEVPDVNGAVPQGFLTKETEVVAKMALRGTVNWENTPYTNPWEGVLTNFVHLQSVLPGPYSLDASASTKVCHFELTGGAVLEGPCQVRGLKQGGSGQDGNDGDVVLLATCRVRLTDGLLHPV